MIGRKLEVEFFQPMSSLTILRLDSNELSILSPHTFSGLRALEELNLSDNLLSLLPDNVFLHLFQLKYLRLSFNRLQVTLLIVARLFYFQVKYVSIACAFS